MSDVGILVERSVFGNERISENIFGGNYINNYDTSDGTFSEKGLDLGLSIVRFPGGSNVESLFDVSNPDADMALGQSITPLSDFLSMCEINGFKPVIQIPTKRYVDDIHAGIREVSGFIDQLTSGAFGNVEVFMFEIGNEYNFSAEAFGQAGITAEEYGEVASALAAAVKEASKYDVPIAVQTGFTEEDNQQIVEFFDTAEERDAVDVVVFHAYPWRQGTVESLFDSKAELAETWESRGIASEVFLSEWNVRSLRDYDPVLMDYGLAQASTLVDIVAEIAKKGVDYATAWAVQQNNRTNLARQEGNTDGLRVAGEAFRMMSETLIGTELIVDVALDTSEGEFLIHGFEDDAKYVFFVSAREINDEEDAVSVQLDLSQLDDGISYGWSERLSAAGNIMLPYAQALISTEVVPSSEYLSGNVSLEFGSDFEVHRLVLVKEAPGESQLLLKGDDEANLMIGGSGADTFETGGGNDEVISNGGDDYVVLGDGNDIALAGSGDDRVDGQSGNDLLRGGAGNDQVFGGFGDDILVGGDGNDLLDSSFGFDRLNGGAGQDTIYAGDAGDHVIAGSGDDFVFGEAGNDVIFGMNGNDHIEGGAGSDLLAGQDGNDSLLGGGLADALFGGAGDDFIWGGGGADRLNGGPGADIFWHSGAEGDGQDWIQDFDESEGDRLVVDGDFYSADEFTIEERFISGAGSDEIAELLVYVADSEQYLFVLVDGARNDQIELQFGSEIGFFDIL